MQHVSFALCSCIPSRLVSLLIDTVQPIMSEIWSERNHRVIASKEKALDGLFAKGFIGAPHARLFKDSHYKTCTFIVNLSYLFKIFLFFFCFLKFLPFFFLSLFYFSLYPLQNFELLDVGLLYFFDEKMLLLIYIYIYKLISK